MDAVRAVHDLSHVVVNRDARDHVGLLAGKFGKSLGYEKDGLSHRHLHRFLEIRMQAHHDPMSGRFRARPGELQVLAHDELEFSTQPGLDRSEIDLTLALGRMGIAG